MATIHQAGYIFKDDGTAVSGSEAYDGSAWSTVAEMSEGRCYLGGAGTQNAVLAFFGQTPTLAPNHRNTTEEYNGTSWSAGGAGVIARETIGGAGSQDSALAAGGRTPTTVAHTEEYSVTYVKTVSLSS